MNFRRFAVLVGGVLLVSCGEQKQTYTQSERVLIQAPDSAEVWANEVVGCIGRGSWPVGVKWYAARLIPPTVGYGDHSDHSITLDSVVLGWVGTPLYRAVIKHEIAHIAVGWKANHPSVPPLGVVDKAEPRYIFNRKCGTLP